MGNSPSAVHSANPTSTTKVGLTHRIALHRLHVDPASGGYVLVWLDSINALLLDHPLTQQTLGAVEQRAIAWAQYLMYRRFGPQSNERREAQNKLQTFLVSANGEAKILPPKIRR